MACESRESKSTAKISKPAAETKPAKKKPGDDEVRTVPNQFPLKDGKLPKPKPSTEKTKSNTKK